MRLLRRDVRCDEHLTKLFELLLSTDLLDKEGHLNDVEVLGVKLFVLVEVLALHLATSIALITFAGLLGEKQLVDDDGVGVDAVAGKLLDHALRLVKTKELGDADTDKGSEFGVLELGVHFADGLAQRLELFDHVVKILAIGELATRTEEAIEERTVLR